MHGGFRGGLQKFSKLSFRFGHVPVILMNASSKFDDDRAIGLGDIVHFVKLVGIGRGKLQRNLFFTITTPTCVFADSGPGKRRKSPR